MSKCALKVKALGVEPQPHHKCKPVTWSGVAPAPIWADGPQWCRRQHFGHGRHRRGRQRQGDGGAIPYRSGSRVAGSGGKPTRYKADGWPLVRSAVPSAPPSPGDPITRLLQGSTAIPPARRAALSAASGRKRLPATGSGNPGSRPAGDDEAVEEKGAQQAEPAGEQEHGAQPQPDCQRGPHQRRC